MSEPDEERLAALLGEAGALAEAVRDAYKPPSAIVESSDAAGVVTVTLEGTDRRVTRAVVAADWKDKIGPEGLELAIVEAVLSAQLGPVRDFLSAVTDAVPPAAPRPSPPPRAAKDPTTALDWDDLGRMFDTVDRALDAFATNRSGEQGGMAAGDPGVAITGSSDNRRITVSLVNGQPTSVKIDHRWLGSTNRQSLCDSLVQAFTAAYSADSHRDTTATSATGLSTALQSIVEQMGINPQTPSREEPEA